MGDISWNERKDKCWMMRPPVHSPMKNFLVRIAIRQGRVSEERGELYFVPGQNHVPIVVMDSMGQHFERPPHAIYVVWHGATMANLVKWVKTHTLALKDRPPLPLKVIIVGGGNSLSSRLLTHGKTGNDLANPVISQITDLSLWCEASTISLTVGSVLPRPADHDEYKTKIFNVASLKRKILSAALVKVNKFIKSLNKRNAAKQLPLHRFVCYCGKSEDSEVSYPKSKSKNRLYPGTTLYRIRLACFNNLDWVHLSAKGTKRVGDVLIKHVTPA